MALNVSIAVMNKYSVGDTICNAMECKTQYRPLNTRHSEI